MRCSPRWRTSTQVALVRAGAAVRAGLGACRCPAGSSGSPASQCAPCIAHGTTCSSRQNTAPRSPACSARRKPSVGSTGLPHHVHFDRARRVHRWSAPPRVDSGRCPTGPGLSSSRGTRRARSCSSRRCGCWSRTSAASRSSSSTTTSRSRTAAAPQNEVVLAAARAMREAGYGIKAATITPEGADDVGSPNQILREAIDGKVIIRAGPPDPGRARRSAACTTRSSVVRMAVEDAYGAEERREARGRRRGRVPHRARAPLGVPRGRRVRVPHRRAHARARLRRAEVDRQPRLRGHAQGGAGRRRRAASRTCPTSRS